MTVAHQPRKRFGQHFLHDRRVIDRIIGAVAPQSGDCMVEIGPGLGALTDRLLERLTHLHVIEIDRDLAARLSERYSSDRLSVHIHDALRFDFARLSTKIPTRIRVLGNLPYNISTPILFHLAKYASDLVDGHFMLQREVVDRMVARPATAEYGRLSVAVQARFVVERLFNVGAGSFQPPPKVESALVRMVPRTPTLLTGAIEPAFDALVTRAFGQRRKTLRNALAGMVDEARLAQLGVDPRVRGETLDFLTYIRIAAAI
jgi:16S rRNA (adenine1518-N6/adenine1519-N6)-dimethyltransferase